MKRAIFAVCVCVITFSIESCKKSISEVINDKATIVGDWELSVSSGMGGSMPVAPGNGNKWRFTGNNFYQYIHDSLADKGTYSIIKDNTIPNVITGGELDLAGNIMRRYNFRLQNRTTLVIDFGSAFDAPIFTYTRR